MGEDLVTEDTIVEELVGIIGMLDSKDGSTLTEITTVLESLHGPLDREVVQESLMSAVALGRLDCYNRRYKVYKQKNIYDKPTPGCSSWRSEEFMDVRDLKDDEESVSSIWSEISQYMNENDSCPDSEKSYIVKEILSVKSIASSGQLSPRSYQCDSFSSEESLVPKPKVRKISPKKGLVVKWPMPKKCAGVKKDTVITTVNLDEKDTVNTAVNLDEKDIVNTNVNLDERQEEFEFSANGKNKHDNLPAKKSLNDLIMDVMTKFSKKDNANDNIEKEVQNINAPGSSNSDAMNGVVESLDEAITEVMKRFTGRSVYECDTEGVPGNVAMSADPCSIKTASRSVGTESQDQASAGSNTVKPAKRGRHRKEELGNDSDVNDCRHLTRSRAKNELMRSTMQSPSETDVSSIKKPKLS